MFYTFLIADRLSFPTDQTTCLVQTGSAISGRSWKEDFLFNAALLNNQLKPLNYYFIC